MWALVLYMIWLPVYYLFGEPDCVIWSSIYFIFQNILILGLLYELRCWSKHFVFFVDVLLLLQVFELLFNIFSIFNVNLFEKLNRCGIFAASLVCVMLIYTIYDRRSKS